MEQSNVGVDDLKDVCTAARLENCIL